ncbi:hypothetical protein AVEN_125354-1 [Araneus ventricosus]|uniref:Uncharacterized protein n=1 Tax=Araneus ventricosus TaxID=182803 RepID=A0A4Y2CT41_ARAVE|nr:hypothetical protein AVEN_125354-1 [Araneus ventricosus]
MKPAIYLTTLQKTAILGVKAKPVDRLARYERILRRRKEEIMSLELHTLASRLFPREREHDTTISYTWHHFYHLAVNIRCGIDQKPQQRGFWF